jgi:hypothetical protein
MVKTKQVRENHEIHEKHEMKKVIRLHSPFSDTSAFRDFRVFRGSFGIQSQYACQVPSIPVFASPAVALHPLRLREISSLPHASNKTEPALSVSRPGIFPRSDNLSPIPEIHPAASAEEFPD